MGVIYLHIWTSIESKEKEIIWTRCLSRIRAPGAPCLKKIRVKFISIYSDIFGKEMVLELRDDATIDDLLDYLRRELSEKGVDVKPIVFVNYRFPREHQVLNDGDEVLVMPPFAGG